MTSKPGALVFLMVTVFVAVLLCCRETTTKDVSHTAQAPREVQTVAAEKTEQARPVSDADPVNLFYVQERLVDESEGGGDRTQYVAVRQNWKETEGTVLKTVDDNVWVDVSSDFSTLYEFIEYRDRSERPNSYIEKNIQMTDLRSGKKTYLYGPDVVDVYYSQNKLDSNQMYLPFECVYKPDNIVFFVESSSFGRFNDGVLTQIREIDSRLCVTHLLPFNPTRTYCYFYRRYTGSRASDEKLRVGIYDFTAKSMRELIPNGVDTLFTTTSISCDTRTILAYDATFSSNAEYRIDLIDSTYTLRHRTVYTSADLVADIQIDPNGNWVYFSTGTGISRIKIDDILSVPNFDDTWFNAYREVLYERPTVNGVKYSISNLRIMKPVRSDK